MKLVTFLVPCYNSQDYMQKCIDSILDTRWEIECIIIDDGSTDDTGRIADQYERENPRRVRVVHQPNGGHGAGIMAGIERAEGVFFKVVDSDDWLDKDGLEEYLTRLEELVEEDVQLIVNDYEYDYNGCGKNTVISYHNAFASNQIQTWKEMGNFSVNQYLTIHSCTYRTSVLRECGMDLPRHTFYEDNLYIYLPLPYVHKFYYMNRVLYHYYIGRQGQSMEEENMKLKCDHQIRVSKLIFSAYNLKEIYQKEPKLGKLMLRENVLMLSAATVFARLNKDQVSEEKVRLMWQELKKIDASTARLIKYHTMAFWVCLPGKMGRLFAIINYHMAHRVLKFN